MAMAMTMALWGEGLGGLGWGSRFYSFHDMLWYGMA